MVDRFIIWGYKNVYDTMRHIHEGFYKGLKHLGKEVEWYDECDDISSVDFSGCFIISNHSCVQREGGYWPWEKKRVSMLPIREDSFYAIHGLSDNPAVYDLFNGHKRNLSWNVFKTSRMGMLDGGLLEDEILLDKDAPFSVSRRYMELRWATDLLPHEIEENKPKEMLSLQNPIINWVGTVWRVNEHELGRFSTACKNEGIEFRHIGGGQKGIVSNDENKRLIRESYMAPSISGGQHLADGYVPCRIFKNISYGQFGITNNQATNKLFGDKLIYNPDPYQLFYDARERLASTDVSDLHKLMDEVAEKHTFLNRLKVLFTAAQIIEQ